jgi:hypothetical protein
MAVLNEYMTMRGGGTTYYITVRRSVSACLTLGWILKGYSLRCSKRAGPIIKAMYSSTSLGHAKPLICEQGGEGCVREAVCLSLRTVVQDDAGFYGPQSRGCVIVNRMHRHKTYSLVSPLLQEGLGILSAHQGSQPHQAAAIGSLAMDTEPAAIGSSPAVKATYSTALAFLLNYGCPKTVIVADIHKVLPITLSALTDIADLSQQGGVGCMSPRTEQDSIYSILETLSILLDSCAAAVCDHLASLIPSLLHLGTHYTAAMVTP